VSTRHHSSLQTKYYKNINHVIMFSYFWILSQTKFQQLPQTKSNKFTRKQRVRKLKAVLIFKKTVTMRIQDLELKAGEGGGALGQNTRGPEWSEGYFCCFAQKFSRK
jgi:hypothetical protein